MRLPTLMFLHSSTVTGEEGGQFHHRVAMPMTQLRAGGMFDVSEARWITLGALDAAMAADLTVVINSAGPFTRAVMNMRKALGLPTVLEISDDPTAPRSWKSDDAQPTRGMLFNLMNMAAAANAVQFSSQGLVKRYSSWNANCCWLPNFFTLDASEPSRHASPMFGWAGTASHITDLAVIAPWIEAYCEGQPEARFLTMGSQRIADLFGGLAPNQYEHRNFGRYADYLNTLRQMTVGVVPVSEDKFSAGRTDIKPIEMAMCGVLPVIQDAPNHVGLPTCFPRFEDANGMTTLLDRFLWDQAARHATIKECQDWIQKHRGAAVTVQLHQEWYAKWCPKPTGRAMPDVVQDLDHETFVSQLIWNPSDLEPELCSRVREALRRWPNCPILATKYILLRSQSKLDSKVWSSVCDNPVVEHLIRSERPDLLES